MGARYLTDLADVIRAAGLAVIEVGSSPSTTGTAWKSRARKSGGYDSPRPTHVMVHHTASGPSSDGWPDVNYQCFSSGNENKPTANLYLSRSGTVWVMAAGATNTNGTGTDTWGGGVPPDSMNTHAIGIEAGNDGVGEPWPTAQQDAYVRLCDALGAAYGIAPHYHRGHVEWAPGRKIDPAGPSRWAPGGGTWPMDGYRADLGGSQPPSPEEDPMRIIVLMDLPDTPAILLTGHVGAWLDPGRYTAFKTAYGISDEHGDTTWLANVVMDGRIPKYPDGREVPTWKP